MRPRSFVALVLGAVAVTASGSGAQQMRRRAGGPPGDAHVTIIPANPHFPFAGTWGGTRTVEGNRDPVVIAVDVANGKYFGAIIHPDGSMAEHQHEHVEGNALTWDSPNSGGGTWVYRVKLVGPDSIAGTVALQGAPAIFGPKPPSGTVTLARRK